MAEHPCKNMTKAQREAFERIAVNQQPDCTWPTIDAAPGGWCYRARSERDAARCDAMGIYHIPSFFVPIAVHAQWCEWCRENVGEIKCKEQSR